MKYLYLFLLIVILLSCSELPTRDNPYDIHFDMPEPENLKVEHLTLTSKQISWEYDLDRFDGFILSRKHAGDWIVIDTLDSETRSYIENDVPVNENIQYKIYAYADQNHSDEVFSNSISALPAPYEVSWEVEDENIILSWEYDCEVIEGFRIEKKAYGGDWQLY